MITVPERMYVPACHVTQLPASCGPIGEKVLDLPRVRAENAIYEKYGNSMIEV